MTGWRHVSGSGTDIRILADVWKIRQGSNIRIRISEIEMMPVHQISDMSRCTISPESRQKLKIVILSSSRFLTI